MERQLIITRDGSPTIFVPELNEHYHSVNGAVQESLHVFIQEGFNYVNKDITRILEIGFGTGLNALLTAIESNCQNKKVYYESLEPYPIDEQLWTKLGYDNLPQFTDYFSLMHTAAWDTEIQVNQNFVLKKLKVFMQDYQPSHTFDLIYYDAFSPTTQPELWTADIFKKLYTTLSPDGILVTYSSKGLVKQNLRSAGFSVFRLPGAAGKRHMLRAVKNKSCLVSNSF